MSKDGSMQTGACILEHADRSMPTERCDKKGEGHEYGSMQTGAIYIKKIYIRFFQFAWNCNQGINYLFYFLITDNIFI